MTGVNQEEDTLTLSDTCGGNVTVDTVSVSPGNMKIQNVNLKKNKSLKKYSQVVLYSQVHPWGTHQQLNIIEKIYRHNISQWLSKI